MRAAIRERARASKLWFFDRERKREKEREAGGEREFGFIRKVVFLEEGRVSQKKE